jgi:DNA-binding Lrp family transcriptional regulator
MSKHNSKLNHIDIALMRLLSEDGRMRDVEMARIIGVSNDTVQRHRTHLEQAGYFRIEAVFNSRKFGYTNVYQLGLVLAPGVDTRAFADKLAHLGQVLYVALSLGPTHSIIANCRSRDQLELNRLIEELRTWKEIERVDVNIIYDVVKAMYHRLPEDAL